MTAKMPPLVPNLTQFALRFAVVSDMVRGVPRVLVDAFQSALRFAVVSDIATCGRTSMCSVSIRFEVRGGFRRTRNDGCFTTWGFQSALRFAVVSDVSRSGKFPGVEFQSALRFAVVSDYDRYD